MINIGINKSRKKESFVTYGTYTIRLKTKITKKKTTMKIHCWAKLKIMRRSKKRTKRKKTKIY